MTNLLLVFSREWGEGEKVKHESRTLGPFTRLYVEALEIKVEVGCCIFPLARRVKDTWETNFAGDKPQVWTKFQVFSKGE